MIDIQGIRNLVGRPLTEQEQRHLAWINGWDSEARSSFVGLIKAAYWNGAKEGGETVKESASLGMTEQDIQQFATALARRYKQVKQEYSDAIDKYNSHFRAEPLHADELQKSFVEQEAKYGQFQLFNEVIATLPTDIHQVFSKAYERLNNEHE